MRCNGGMNGNARTLPLALLFLSCLMVGTARGQSAPQWIYFDRDDTQVGSTTILTRQWPLDHDLTRAQLRVVLEGCRGTVSVNGSAIAHAGPFDTVQVVDVSSDIRQGKNTVTTIAKSDIVSHEPVSISPMPTGLLDTLSRDEVIDLLSFLRFGDRPRDDEGGR